MMLNDVNQGIQKNKPRRRVGRGPGSGHGKTSARGHKGQKSRSGWSRQAVFQGGAMPMVRRIPKRGFNNQWALKVAVINVGDLEGMFEAGEEVTPETLKAKSVLKFRYDVLKVLGNGELKKGLTVCAHRFSKSASEAIEKAGGKVTVLPSKTPVAEKQGRTKGKRSAAGKANPSPKS